MAVSTADVARPSCGTDVPASRALPTSTTCQPSSSCFRKPRRLRIVASAWLSRSEVDPCDVGEYPLGHRRGYPAIHSRTDAVNLRRKAICRCLVGGIEGIARINRRSFARRFSRRRSTVGIADSGSVLSQWLDLHFPRRHLVYAYLLL